MDRRNFLQMLGLGAAAAAVSSTAGASPIVPLFSGRGSKIWTPEHSTLTAHHLVLTRPARTPWERGPTPFGADPTIPRLRRAGWPSIGGHRLHPVDDLGAPPLWDLEGVLLPGAPSDIVFPSNVPDIKVEVPPGTDPHESFYRAATWMRDAFAKQSQRRLTEIDSHVRGSYQLVTLVDTPVFAGSVAPTYDQAGRAFLLQISYTPYAVPAGELELNGWEIYSENGEYPIEVPDEIDMEHLFRVDRSILVGERSPHSLRGRLILPLGRG